MKILKIIILGIVFIISTEIGFLKAKSYKKRLNELNKIECSLNLFRTKIQYTNETIRDIFFQISHIIFSDKDNIFINTINCLNGNSLFEAWNYSISKDLYLSDLDKEILLVFGKNLGKLDKRGQECQLSETNELIKKQIKNAEIDLNKNDKLFKSLGSIGGAILILIFI